MQMLVLQVAACNANVTGALAWLVHTRGHVFLCGLHTSGPDETA